MLCLSGLSAFAACGDDKPTPAASQEAAGQPSGGSRGAAFDLKGEGEGGSAGQVAGGGGSGAEGGNVGDAGNAGEGSNAGEAGKAGQGGNAGGGGSAGEGGHAGEGGRPSGGGNAGEGGNAGQGGVADPPIDGASIIELGLDQRPYTECETYKLGADYAQDAQGIPLKLYRDTYYNHPVLTAQAGLEWLACYRETNNPWYLVHALRAGHHLIDTSDDYDGALFFPYDFDFELHSSSKNVLIAPWYSGMAQGQVLSLFSRLGELTSEPEWEIAAADTLKSFDAARGEAQPWIIDVDEDSSLWIEEYPHDGESHVLNGFMFAMFGLYDYFAWRHDAHAEKIFLQSLHTLRLNVELFREPEGPSAYCLAHRVPSTSYHAIHIAQLRAITRMTSDPYFASVADLFFTDYAPEPAEGSISTTLAAAE